MTIRQRSYKETSQRHLKDTCIQCNSSFKTPLKSSRHGVERVILKGVVLDEERDFEKKKNSLVRGMVSQPQFHCTSISLLASVRIQSHKARWHKYCHSYLRARLHAPPVWPAMWRHLPAPSPLPAPAWIVGMRYATAATCEAGGSLSQMSLNGEQTMCLQNWTLSEYKCNEST